MSLVHYGSAKYFPNRVHIMDESAGLDNWNYSRSLCGKVIRLIEDPSKVPKDSLRCQSCERIKALRKT